MIVVRDINNYVFDKSSSIAIGNFDGIHIGHQMLFDKLIRSTKKYNTNSIVLTFDPHPSKIIYSENKSFLLNTSTQKIKLISNYGIDYLILMSFTYTISRMAPRDFVKDILVTKLKAKHVVVGFNYRFGKNRTGSIEDLEELSELYNFYLDVIPPVTKFGQVVSSSYIRELIRNGDIEKVEACLGRPYAIECTVIRGKGRGKQMGIPTANLDIDPLMVLPKSGVYSVKVRHRNKWYDGIASIGENPTFEEQDLSVEVHIINFSENIYNDKLEVFFKRRIRDIIKFNNQLELKNQILKDIALLSNAKK